MASKIKGLQQWCRKMTDGYRGVEVKDFTVSWRDGLAFCAMIHRFRPDLIDFDSLSKENVYDNNHLAFTVAEQELDIPAFLEAADMVALKTPDKLSIITYVSQYYNKLSTLPQLGGPGVKGKTTPAATGVKRHQKPEPLSEPEPKKVTPAGNAAKGDTVRGKTTTLGDKCKICGNKVYLLERHIEGGQLYHRSCYRHSDLSPTNKVYTRSPFFSPSLHRQDEQKTSTPKTSAGVTSQNKVSDLSKTYDLDNKHGWKKQEATEAAESKAGVQKLLFSDKEKPSGKPHERTKELKHNSHISKDSQNLSDLKFSASASYGEKDGTKNDKKLAATPTFDARAFEKRSMDFLSSEKDSKDVKTPKRQLPLIFQKTEGADDTVSNAINKPVPVTVAIDAGKKDSDLKSGHSGKSEVIKKSTGPVPKPRHFVKDRVEEKMDTTETIQVRDKSSVSPRSTPRNNPINTDLIHEKKSPPKLRKHGLSRPKSPSRDLSPDSPSPPPLPSSAPPPLPASAPPSASRLPSPRHLSHPATKDLQPPKRTPLTGFTQVTHTPTSVHAATHQASTASVTLSRPADTKPKQAVLGISVGTRKEEPMDVDTAVSRARHQYGEEPVAVMVVPAEKGQQEKATLTGLLHSLANIRQTSSVAASSGTTTVSTISITTTTTQTALISEAHKTEKSDSSASSQTKASAVGFVSSKLNKFQTKTADRKPDTGLALTHAHHKEDVREHSNAGETHSNHPHKSGTPRNQTRHDTSKSQSSVLADTELKTPSRHKQKNEKGEPFDFTDDKPHFRSGVSVDRRDRSKSAVDILGVKEEASKKDTPLSGPAPFLQIKLRSTPAKQSDRPKSAGSLLESDESSSKRTWQLEAERRQTALQGTGFVDPETKKVIGGSDTQISQQEFSRPLKSSASKEQPSVLAFQKLATDFSSRKDEVPDKKSPADLKNKASLQSEIQPTFSKAAVSTTEDQNPCKTKVLPTVIRAEVKSKGAPTKPARAHISEESGKPEAKQKSDVSKLNVKDRRTPSPVAEETEAQRVLKKITTGAVDKHTPLPPPRPASPPKETRKKISVDMTFDFSAPDNTMTTPVTKTEVPAVTTTVVKHTPPPRPPPPRKSVSPGHLSAIELQQQLLDIDSKLTELELRGRQLEDSIRSVATAEEEDDMMLEWFQLVTEKNDLVRKETDLVYMTREQELEDEQSQIENQLRYLLSKEEGEKSFEEQEEEEYLIQRKLDIVDQRNCIVDSIDEDRLRYEEEDRDIAQMLHSKGLSRDARVEKGKRVASSTFYT